MTTDQDYEKNKIAKLEVISCTSSAILHFSDRHLPAVIGRNSSRAAKVEGDGCTPVGFLPLRRILYRSDRLTPPRSSIPYQALTEHDAWCDDVTHEDYNHQIRLPHPAKHEKLWLEENVYDIIGVLGYNDDPVRIGRGSAIFLHVATSNMEPTAGCIALSLDDLCWVLEQGLEGILIPN
ncbi:unnamed protein product [Adineta ricciae]|uniref:L,D-TPase catalytic domain-containing protein n=1 Tax=Adineta ricciae TaxID=249248 RepID=A0A815PSG6_ADIRI|nr:unnamed protein product [Adineta ricciae]